MQDFFQFGLSGATLDAIVAKGYETPSPIQALAIPPMLAGDDVTAEAQTGTGKTAAFGIPIVERHRNDSQNGAIALVLTPTRELAIQVAEEIQELAKGSRVGVVTVYGGAGFGRQIDALAQRKPYVLVATPGRLLDLLSRGDANLSTVRTLVLDEADRMLDMGFIRDVEKLINQVPRNRQTALFSATLSRDVMRLARKYMNKPVSVAVQAEYKTADLVEQFHIRVEKADKHDTLLELLHLEKPEQAIVFTRTKHVARRMAEKLRKDGWFAVALQGNMSQAQRERALGAFRDGTAQVLVATDVASRGLDVPTVSHVVNYDIPPAKETEAYVHRIGRTARMGRTGRAFTFVQSDEHKELRAIEHTTKLSIGRHFVDIPSEGPRPGPRFGEVLSVTPAPRPHRNNSNAGPGRGNGGGNGGGNARPAGRGPVRRNGSGGGGGGGRNRNRTGAGRSSGGGGGGGPRRGGGGGGGRPRRS